MLLYGEGLLWPRPPASGRVAQALPHQGEDKMHFTKIASAVAAASLSLSPVMAQDALTEVSIVVFGPPSLGAFLPPVIEARGFDEGPWPRHHLRGAHTRRLRHPVQFRRVPGGRQRRLADRRSRRVARCRGGIPLQRLSTISVPSSRPATDVQDGSRSRGRDLGGPPPEPRTTRMFRWLAQQQGVESERRQRDQHRTSGPRWLRHGRPCRGRPAVGTGP